MSKTKLSIEHSVLSDEIYVGHLTKDGDCWKGSKKQVVTNDCLRAVNGFITENNAITISRSGGDFIMCSVNKTNDSLRKMVGYLSSLITD